MDSDTIADLKQFIRAELQQQLSDVATTDEVRKIVRSEAGSMVDGAKDELLEAIGSTMTVRDEAIDEQLSDHDQRLVQLEQSLA